MEGLIEGRIVHLVTSEREGAKHYAAIVAGVVDRESGIVNLGLIFESLTTSAAPVGANRQRIAPTKA